MMVQTFTKLKHRFFAAGWHSLLPALLLLCQVKLQAQTLPAISTENGLVPGCTTEEQALDLAVNGSNFSSQARVRIRGTAFTGEIFITPATTPSATRIDISLPANSVVLADAGTLTIDVQQPDAEGDPVFSNAVQLPVYPRTGPIGGAAAVCGNSENSYTVARLTGAASYQWSLTGDATIVSGGTTHTARISFGNTAGTVTLSVTTLNACGTTGTTSALDIQVQAAPTVSLAAFGEVCVNAPAFALSGGSPAGGTYTADGVVATSFDPATAGVGAHSITYYFTQNGCTASATQTITVLATPAVSFATTFSPVCANAPPITLTGGSPAGGSYSGPGVTGTSFDPAAAGAGTHTITYTVSQGGCSGSAVQTIEVLPAPAVSLAAFGNVCVNAPAFALSGGSPAGGTYTVNGVAATSFDPAAAGVGTYTIVYALSQGGCSNSATQTLQVLAAPEVTFAALSPVCVNAPPFTLTGGSPAGGSYSGPGVTGNTFNPATAGVGTHTITYTLTQNGCTNSTTQDITVLDQPAAGIIPPAGGTQACPGAQVVLTATPTASGATYQWLLNGDPVSGAVNSTFGAGVSGSYQVQVTAGGCTTLSDDVGVTILDPSNLIVENAPVSYCAGGNVTLNAITGQDYAYQWFRNGSQVPNQTSPTLTITTPGDYTVRVTPPGCEPITSEAITVTETSQIAGNDISTTAGEVVCTGTTILITGSVPTGGSGTYLYQWQRREDTGDMENIPGATGQNLTYATGSFAGTLSFRRMVTSGLCSNASSQIDITVNQVITDNTIAAPAAATVCAGQQPGAITGSLVTSVADVVYTWESRVNGTGFAAIPGATGADFTPEALTRTTFYRRVARSGDCTSTSNTVTITVQPAIAGNSIAAPATLICSNTDAGTLTGGTLTGGDGSTYSFVWESSPDGSVFTPIPGATAAGYAPGALTQTTTYRRLVSSGTCTSTSNAVTITVHETITGNSIAVAAATVCSGAEAATITGDPPAGGDGSTYSFVWESSPDGTVFTPIPGATAAGYAPGVLPQTTTYRRLVSSGACTSTSNAVTITVAPVATYTVLLTVPAGLPVCGETLYSVQVIRNVSVVNYPADARSQQVSWQGGEDVTGLFVFDWWKNDAQSLQTGTTGNTITLAALQPGEYYTVRARPASGELTCAIYNNRPDLVPAGGGEGLLFSNQIFSGHEEGYGVSITADVQSPICPGTPVTFTAFPNDPAYVNPTYQWMVNNQDIEGATQPSFTASNLSGGDVVTVRFNSAENACSPVTAANPITMQLLTPVANTITRIEGPNKPGTGQPATFQAFPIDNTIGWRYQWTLTYTDDRVETPSETSATLTIASFPADLQQITVTQIAPEGNCVNQAEVTATAFTAPLPVELLYLKARRQGRQTVVEWATAMEQQNAGFEVQVSEDAVSYRPLGFVPSRNANATIRQVYSFQDQENGQYGTRYYRLKQVDIGGNFVYFGPAALTIEEQPAGMLAYPNPFTSEIHLELQAPADGNMNLVLVNALGSKVAEWILPLKRGFNKHVLSFNFHLPPGLYTLLTQTNGRTSRIKLLKQ